LRFGEAYRAEVEQARNIKTYLNANVVEIDTNDTAQAVTECVLLACQVKFWFQQSFILAVGGIENHACC